MPRFKELPFMERPDLSPFILHLTKNTESEDNFTAYENLVSILKTGEIWGSDKKKGFIKGPHTAACFMDIPLASLKYILNKKNSSPDNPRYEPFGIVVTKKTAYQRGCRPVMYLSNSETRRLKLPKDELWRVVRLEVAKQERWISWLHEREWRCKGDFKLPAGPVAVLVKNTKYVKELREELSDCPSEFKSKPQSIIPVNVMCQGLVYL